MPAYPSFIQNIINTTIDSSQNIYGQHLFCLTLNKQSFDIIISKNVYMKAQVYTSSLQSTYNFTSNSIFINYLDVF